MKRIIAAAFAALLLASLLAGCGKKEAQENAGFDGTMTDLAEKMYENHSAIDLNPMTNPVDLTDGDMLFYQTGLSSGDKLSEAVISEAMMGQPYSLVLARVKDPADAASVAQEMYDNIDQRKWICVEADTKTAGYCGDVVMFFMVGSDFSDSVTTSSMMDAFRASCTGDVAVIG